MRLSCQARLERHRLRTRPKRSGRPVKESTRSTTDLPIHASGLDRNIATELRMWTFKLRDRGWALLYSDHGYPPGSAPGPEFWPPVRQTGRPAPTLAAGPSRPSLTDLCGHAFQPQILARHTATQLRNHRAINVAELPNSAGCQ